MKKIILTSVFIFTSTNLSANTLTCKSKMCNRGNAKSCYEMGYAYENAWQRDRSKSSCGVVQALYSFSNCSDSTTDNYNYCNAIKHYKKSIALGDPQGYNALGVLYTKGKGVPKNIYKAKKLFYKACMSGSETACYNYQLLQRSRY